MTAGCLSLVSAVLLSAAPARATSDLVFFDPATGYGFDQGFYGLPVDATADNYHVAANRQFNPYVGPGGDTIEFFLLLDEQTSGAWLDDCFGAGPSCVQRALIDVTWQVEINPAHPDVGDEAMRVLLFLASPDRNPIFDSLEVGVRYDPAHFEVVQYPSYDGQGNPYDYHFLGFDLGPLLPGVPAAATVSFQYEIVGDLPTDPATGAPLGPGIGGGAAIIAVPEPGTALLAMLGLGGLALLGGGRPREIHLK